MGRELTPDRISPFTSVPCDTVVLCGISTCFQVLSPCLGQIAHALLTRPPLEHSLPFRRTSNYVPARLACVKHAASVRPEPGSNSDVQSLLVTASLDPVSPKTSPRSSAPSVYSLRNLTVLSLDLLFAVSFSRIVRFALAQRRIYYIKTPPVCQPLSAIFLRFSSCTACCDFYFLKPPNVGKFGEF